MLAVADQHIDPFNVFGKGRGRSHADVELDGALDYRAWSTARLRVRLHHLTAFCYEEAHNLQAESDAITNSASILFSAFLGRLAGRLGRHVVADPAELDAPDRAALIARLHAIEETFSVCQRRLTDTINGLADHQDLVCRGVADHLTRLQTGMNRLLAGQPLEHVYSTQITYAILRDGCWKGPRIKERPPVPAT